MRFNCDFCGKKLFGELTIGASSVVDGNVFTVTPCECQRDNMVLFCEHCERPLTYESSGIKNGNPLFRVERCKCQNIGPDDIQHRCNACGTTLKSEYYHYKGPGSSNFKYFSVKECPACKKKRKDMMFEALYGGVRYRVTDVKDEVQIMEKLDNGLRQLMSGRATKSDYLKALALKSQETLPDGVPCWFCDDETGNNEWKTGWFHGWATDHNTEGQYPVGIIEPQNGPMVSAYVEDISFDLESYPGAEDKWTLLRRNIFFAHDGDLIRCETSEMLAEGIRLKAHLCPDKEVTFKLKEQS